MPGSNRVSSAETILYLGSLRERLTVIGLDGEEMMPAAELAAASGAVIGGIYDAVIGQYFVKSRADWLYTWNLKHFRRLESGIGAKVRLP